MSAATGSGSTCPQRDDKPAPPWQGHPHPPRDRTMTNTPFPGPQIPTLVQHVLARIDLGQLNPGDLLDEAELSETYGVSRTPVREAILYLEALGLVRRLPRKGATLFRPTLEEFLAILEVHAKLEGQAAGLAARRLSRQGAADLEAAVRACEAHAKTHPDSDPDGYYQHNLRFHECVAIASGNGVLLESLKTNARKLLAYYRARYRFAGSITQSAKEHRAIAQRITDRDSTGAEAAMQAHVQFDQVTAMDLIAALS
jgi:DNA-binding GntR family transcriptional regulator